MYNKLKKELDQAIREVLLASGHNLFQAQDRVSRLKEALAVLMEEVYAIDEAVEYLEDHLEAIKNSFKWPGTTTMVALGEELMKDVAHLIKALKTKTAGGISSAELDEIHNKEFDEWAEAQKEYPRL